MIIKPYFHPTSLVIKHSCSLIVHLQACSYVSGWGPYAHFDALDETRSNSIPAPPANGFEMHVMQFQTARNSDFVTVPLGTNSSSTSSDVEAGRM